MSDKKIIIFLITVVVVMMTGGVMILSSNATPVSQLRELADAKAYTMEATSFDWGTISFTGKKATKTFTIKNIGKDTLELFDIRTSCHCTTAYLTIDGKQSPQFGMSSVYDWVGRVLPGRNAKLTVVFDQAFHGPQGAGPVIRYVEVKTNDKSNPQITFTLTGTVLNK